MNHLSAAGFLETCLKKILNHIRALGLLSFYLVLYWKFFLCWKESRRNKSKWMYNINIILIHIVWNRLAFFSYKTLDGEIHCLMSAAKKRRKKISNHFWCGLYRFIIIGCLQIWFVFKVLQSGLDVICTPKNFFSHAVG